MIYDIYDACEESYRLRGDAGGRDLDVERRQQSAAFKVGEQASDACNAMAAGVEELQGAGKKAQWREVLAEMTESITEDGKIIPGFEDICAPSGRAGLKQIRAHVSKALEECGVVGSELEHKMTPFERVKTGVQDLAFTKLVSQQLRDGIRLPPSHVLDFVMGLSSDRSKVTGKTLIPLLQEVSVVLEGEMTPNLRTDQLLLYRLDACLSRAFQAAPADKNKVKKWQEESLAQGDVGDMAAARKAEVIKDRHRSFLQLRGATAEQRPQPEEAHDPWIAFDLTPEKTHTKQRPQIDIEQP